MISLNSICFGDESLLRTSQLIGCESGASPSACGAVGRTRTWSFATVTQNGIKRSVRDQSLNGVFEQLNMPVDQDSSNRIKRFVENADEIIKEHQTRLRAVYQLRLSKSLDNSAMKNSFAEEASIESALRQALGALESKTFGKINPRSYHPAEVFANYGLTDVRHEYEIKGMKLRGADRATESYISKQRSLYSQILKTVRSPKFFATSIARLSAGGALAVASLGISAATVAHNRVLVRECAQKLGVSLDQDDFSRLSALAFSNSGVKDKATGCDQLTFQPGAVEILAEANGLTSKAKDFFEKYGTEVKSRLERSFDKDLKPTCGGYSWGNTEVKVQDSKLFIKSTIDNKVYDTEISWNSVDEWDYMTLHSSNSDYQQYLSDKVKSLTPNSTSGRTAQKLQMSTAVSCRVGQVGLHDRARCEVAKAIAIWNQYSETHNEKCEQGKTTDSAMPLSPPVDPVKK